MTAQAFVRCDGCQVLFAGTGHRALLTIERYMHACSPDCAAAVARQMWIDSVAEGDVDPTLQKEVKSQ